MILRTVIIDDEYKGISTLKALIEGHIPDVRVVADTTSASEAIQLIEDYKPEIVLLDINMPEMNGFELLEKLTWKNFNLVFTTAHNEYALKALKHNAVDYILKPIDHEDLRAAVDRVKQRMSRNADDLPATNYLKLLGELNLYHKNKIVVSHKSGIESVDVKEILYIETTSNVASIYLSGGRQLSTARTLKDFEDELCSNNMNFMRVHNSFIINLHRVIRYLRSEECIILDEGLKVPLSKSKKEIFYNWMNL